MRWMIYTFFYLLFFSLLVTNFVYSSYEAVVIVPVANVVNEPFSYIAQDLLKKAYESSLPYQKKNEPSCGRLHQLLFNERVTVIGEYNYQSQITIPQAYYITGDSSIPQCTYWILSSYLYPLNEKNILITEKTIPPSIDFHNQKTIHNNQIISLYKEHYEPKLALNFSPGTRFIKDTASSTTNDHNVIALCPQSIKLIHFKIPKKKCVESSTASFNLRKKKFISILLEWVKEKDKVIPYVLGGCSISWYPHQQFEKIVTNNSELYYYPLIKSMPIRGIDCSGLILRALHIAGIPYFFKNTFTLKQKLSPLSVTENLQEGDLIWIPGHVMVIVNTKKNQIVEARGYEHGYGKVQKISINKIFKDVTTFEQLKKIFHAKKPLYRIDKNGIIREIVKEFYLFNLDQLLKL